MKIFIKVLFNLLNFILLLFIFIISYKNNLKLNLIENNMNNKLPNKESKKPKIDTISKVIKFNGIQYSIFKIYNHALNNLVLYYKDENEVNYKSFKNLHQDLNRKGYNLLFATNAGIYTKNFAPEGLFIQNKKIVNPLNLKNGKGNFYLKPNGVFFIIDNKPNILETSEFENNIKLDDIQFAVQSGPLIIDKGKIHKSFTETSNNKNIRNAVCVDNNSVIFVLSNNDVTFYDFSLFFLNRLKCKSALYLDGAISDMFLPKINRTLNNIKNDGKFSGIFGYIERK
ncbi:MAG: phosphodiester glycosidase family protein [Leptospiraceae bacterium]|nr:phosphodiester glycosidase family protein [Leptospiraceae bacterium]